MEKYREELVEKACEQDEEVLEAYLESGEAPDTATLKKCIRKGTLSFSFLARYQVHFVKCYLDQHTSRFESCRLSLNEEWKLSAWTQDINYQPKSMQESI